MQNKKYTLVAWTEKGELHMVPSLVNEVSLPYREKIARLENQGWEDEIGWLLALSNAHEKLALFFLSVGYPVEAYIEYKNAAMVCSYCSDHLWLQGVSCDFPALPLLYRFLSMHWKARDLARKHPVAWGMYRDSELERSYLFFTRDDRETDREFDEAMASRKAWSFGKSA